MSSATMSESLADLVDPESTTIIGMEMQRGVVGDLARFEGPAEAVRDAGIVECCARLYASARDRGIRILHAQAAFRPDRAGTYRNMPFVNQLMGDPEHLPVGSPAVEVVPELFDPQRDLLSQRLHGISPFAGTDLDAYLRSLGTRTVVVTGVSLNRGIIGTSMEAINHGYRVVIPRDAVAGYPKEYGEAVLQYTLDGLTTLTTVEALLTLWS